MTIDKLDTLTPEKDSILLISVEGILGSTSVESILELAQTGPITANKLATSGEVGNRLVMLQSGDEIPTFRIENENGHTPGSLILGTLFANTVLADDIIVNGNSVLTFNGDSSSLHFGGENLTFGEAFYFLENELNFTGRSEKSTNANQLIGVDGCFFRHDTEGDLSWKPTQDYSIASEDGLHGFSNAGLFGNGSQLTGITIPQVAGVNPVANGTYLTPSSITIQNGIITSIT